MNEILGLLHVIIVLLTIIISMETVSPKCNYSQVKLQCPQVRFFCYQKSQSAWMTPSFHQIGSYFVNIYIFKSTYVFTCQVYTYSTLLDKFLWPKQIHKLIADKVLLRWFQITVDQKVSFYSCMLLMLRGAIREVFINNTSVLFQLRKYMVIQEDLRTTLKRKFPSCSRKQNTHTHSFFCYKKQRGNPVNKNYVVCWSTINKVAFSISWP